MLLSFLHRTGDVENRAAGALRVHWMEGTRNERMVSGFADDILGRNIREDGMAAIATVALPFGSCRCNVSAAAVGRRCWVAES